jgi:hypothetical protein
MARLLLLRLRLCREEGGVIRVVRALTPSNETRLPDKFNSFTVLLFYLLAK